MLLHFVYCFIFIMIFFSISVLADVDVIKNFLPGKANIERTKRISCDWFFTYRFQTNVWKRFTKPFCKNVLFLIIFSPYIDLQLIGWCEWTDKFKDSSEYRIVQSKLINSDTFRFIHQLNTNLKQITLAYYLTLVLNGDCGRKWLILKSR